MNVHGGGSAIGPGCRREDAWDGFCGDACVCFCEDGDVSFVFGEDDLFFSAALEASALALRKLRDPTAVAVASVFPDPSTLAGVGPWLGSISEAPHKD